MAQPINMPQVGQDIETAKILEWKVKEGDPVKQGDIVAVVESDKANFEVEAPEAGTILKLLFAVDDEAAVLQPIAYVGKAGEAMPSGGGGGSPAAATAASASAPVSGSAAQPINMPQVGQDIETAKILEWKVKEGDGVKQGDIVAVVESDKASFEVESPADGTILKLLYEVDEEGKVLEPLAYVGAEGDRIPDTASVQPAAPQAPAPAVTSAPAAKTVAGQTGPTGKVIASPVAKRIAREKGLSLQGIKGTGPNGRIVKRDVMGMQAGAAAAPAPAARAPQPVQMLPMAADDQVIPFNRMRQRIADRLTQSKQTIPHFYLQAEIDMTRAVAWRVAYNQEHQTRITINDLILKAVASSLAEFPNLNAHVYPDRVVLKKDINVGVAVSVENGLLVPVIPNADQMDLLELSRTSRSNAEGARRGVIDTRVQGTFTISNLGMFAIRAFVPIVNPPEAAIIGIGTIAKRVVPSEVGTGFRIRDIMEMCVSCDHRATDGVYVAQFIEKMKFRLESWTGDV